MGWVGSLGLLVLLASEFLLIWFFYFLFSLASFFLTACLQVLVGAAGLLLGCCWGLLGAGGCCWWLLAAAGVYIYILKYLCLHECGSCSIQIQ